MFVRRLQFLDGFQGQDILVGVIPEDIGQGLVGENRLHVFEDEDALDGAFNQRAELLLAFGKLGHHVLTLGDVLRQPHHTHGRSRLVPQRHLDHMADGKGAIGPSHRDVMDIHLTVILKHTGIRPHRHPHFLFRSKGEFLIIFPPEILRLHLKEFRHALIDVEVPAFRILDEQPVGHGVEYGFQQPLIGAGFLLGLFSVCDVQQGGQVGFLPFPQGGGDDDIQPIDLAILAKSPDFIVVGSGFPF